MAAITNSPFPSLLVVQAVQDIPVAPGSRIRKSCNRSTCSSRCNRARSKDQKLISAQASRRDAYQTKERLSSDFSFPLKYPAPFTWLRKSLKNVTRKFLAIETSSCTACDPIKRQAPGWRSCCDQRESPESARMNEGSMPGSRTNSHSKPRVLSRKPR